MVSILFQHRAGPRWPYGEPPRIVQAPVAIVVANWKFDDTTYERTAVSFDNPDFVNVVLHSYRHRFGNAPADPALESIERRAAARPPITVPTVALLGEGNGIGVVTQADTQAHFFTGPYKRRLIPVIGHNFPQEAPNEAVAAVLELLRSTT